MPDRNYVIAEIVEHIEATLAVDSEYVNIPLDLLQYALVLLKEQETIVRCISCAFYRSDGQCALHNGKWRPDGFCSWAIRKEGR